jgi:hypothetical protein
MYPTKTRHAGGSVQLQKLANPHMKDRTYGGSNLVLDKSLDGA